MTTLDQAGQDLLFFNARTQNGYLPTPVPEALLKQVYDLARMGPTSMNTQPMRLVFVTSEAAKARLLPTVSPGNVDKVKQAPVIAIIATDTRFYENMPTIWHREGARENFAGNPAMAEATAYRNSTLGGAYLIIAARALGLECGPMSGFAQPKVDAEFFPDGRFKSNFLCALGYGDPSKIFDRNRRLDFSEACTVL